MAVLIRFDWPLTRVMRICGDGHLAGFCGYSWAAAIPIFSVSTWRSGMGAIAKRGPWQKGSLETCHGAHGKKAMAALKGVPPRPHGAS